MKILILDGDNFQALRLVRDIANSHKVFVGGKSKTHTLSYFSKYCKGFVSYNDDDLNSFGNVLEFIEKKRINLIIPTTERSCLILNSFRQDVERINNCILALDRTDKLQIAFDKVLTFEFCKRYKIPTPEINLLDSSNLKTQVVVLKDRSSNKIEKDGSISKTSTPCYLNNQTANFNNDKSKFFQEFIRGSSIGFFALCNEGEIIDAYSHLRILDTNPSGSGSCVRKSITNIPKDLFEMSKKIIHNLKWNGPIMLEFLKDNSKNLYLLEINGRLWGSYCLASYSGKDFTSKLIDLFSRQPKKHPISNEKNIVVTNEVLLVLRWLRILKGPNKYSSEKFPKRRQILFELKFLFSKKELLSDYDPLPILRFLWKK